MARNSQRNPESGQIPAIFLLIGLLALAAVASVLLLDPGTSTPVSTTGGPEPEVGEDEPDVAQVDANTVRQPAEVERVPDQVQRTASGSSGDSRPIGAAVFGTVIDVRGDPVADAVVSLSERQQAIGNPFSPGEVPSASFTTTANAQGVYRFSRLPSEVEFNVWVNHTDYAPSEGFPIRALADEEQQLQPIVLDEGYVIEGMISDTAGNPLQGATVAVRMNQVFADHLNEEVMDAEIRAGRVQRLETDAAGMYRASTLAKGIYQIEASLEDFASGVENAVSCLGDEKVVRKDITLGTEHRLAGIVRNEAGDPVAGAIVAAARTRPRPIYQSIVTSDESGAFEMRGLPEGGYGISVRADGYASTRMSQVQSNRTDLELVMRQKGAVSGTVTLTNGEPVKSYSLELFRVNKGTTQFGVTNLKMQVQSETGDYTFPGLDRGSYALLVRAEGKAPTYTGGFYVERDPVTGINAVLEAGGTVRGTVLDPNDRPAPGVTVTLRGQDFKEWHQSSIFGTAVGDPNNVPNMSATTDKQGKFKIENAYPGDLQLELKHPSYLTTYVGAYVQIDRVSDVGEVSLRRGSSVSGVVDVRGGGAAAGASVYLTLKDEDAGFFNKKTIADARGRYRFDGLRPGLYEVSAVRDDSNSFFFPGATPGSAQEVLIQREAEQREANLTVPAQDG